MTTKKGGGSSGSGRPPPPARPAPGPPPQPKRPQLRPIGGAKPPVIRPVTPRVPTAPKAPAAPAPPKLAPFESSPDDDATSVMDRPVFDSERSLPKAKPSTASQTRSGSHAQRAPAPAAGRPATDTRATRPDIDLVPKSQRGSSERTIVMPNAPARPPHAGGAPRFPSPGSTARTGASKRGPSHVPSMREPVPTEIEPIAPRMTSATHTTSERPPPSNRPPHDAAAALPMASSSPPVDVPPPPRMPVQDETVAMYRGNWTPSAPPIAFGPIARSTPSAAPPPNVRTRPASVAPPANMLGPGPLPMPAAAVSLPPQAPGVLGLVLFAAPLAFATMAVAALALL